jgi:hypothetical protein
LRQASLNDTPLEKHFFTRRMTFRNPAPTQVKDEERVRRPAFSIQRLSPFAFRGNVLRRAADAVGCAALLMETCQR